MVVSPGSQAPKAAKELAGAWSAAGLAVIALAGLFVVSDPESGREALLWFLAPAMLLAAAAAGWLGLRARHDGADAGRWPAMVGFAISGFSAFALLLALIGRLLGLE